MGKSAKIITIILIILVIGYFVVNNKSDDTNKNTPSKNLLEKYSQ